MECFFDMETQDPDDVMTLCILASHPDIKLKGVTIIPGTKHQVGLVKHILNLLNKKIPVGVGVPKKDVTSVSEFHYKWFGKIDPEEADDSAINILKLIDNGDIIITGAPLTNIGNFLDVNTKTISIVAQGGFAGDSVVPKEFRLSKFNGKETCPTFNLNGNIKSAFKVLEYPFLSRYFVSKNLCHGIKWDQKFHNQIYKDKYPGLKLIHNGMSLYLKKRKEGKALHDPLAAFAAFNEDAFSWKEVEIYREKGEWGSRIKSGTNTKISISTDINKFINFINGA